MEEHEEDGDVQYDEEDDQADVEGDEDMGLGNMQVRLRSLLALERWKCFSMPDAIAKFCRSGPCIQGTVI